MRSPSVGIRPSCSRESAFGKWSVHPVTLLPASRVSAYPAGENQTIKADALNECAFRCFGKRSLGN